MKAISILRKLIEEGISTENCGIFRVYETISYTEFIRQYLYHDFEEYPSMAVPEGEYFFCWSDDEVDFGSCYVHCIEGHYLHVMQLNDE